MPERRKTTGIYIGPELEQALKVIAAIKGISLSQFTRDVFLEYFVNHPEITEEVQRISDQISNLTRPSEPHTHLDKANPALRE